MNADFIESRSIPEPNSGCWLWTASILNTGYGLARLGGKQKSAHRASWEAHFGNIPPGMHVCHRCDNRACVNPQHLFLGTAADNNRDMIQKGRHRNNPRRGEAHPCAKLTREDVATIRVSRETNRALAMRFGISHQQIGVVRNGVNWVDETPRGGPPATPAARG